MSRLPKCAGWRQHELFDRKDVPAMVPPTQYYAEASSRRVARDKAEHRPVFWQGMASWVRQLASVPPSWRRSWQQDERFRRIAKMLDVEKILASRDGEGLALVEKWLVAARDNGLSDVLSKAAIGKLLVEVRNRRHLLAIGRDRPKLKGPSMDPTALPDSALERLIQSHSDLALVDLLRAERDRRVSAREQQWRQGAVKNVGVRTCGVDTFVENPG